MTDPQPFDLTVVCSGSRWRLAVAGEIDLSSARQLQEVAGVLAAARAPVVDLDLGDVTFVDSAGWRCVEATRHLLEERGAVTTVAATSPAVDRLLLALRQVATAG